MGNEEIHEKATMKSMKKKSGKKGGMKKKAMKVSKIARGRGAKARVFKGLKEKTGGGLKKSGLTRNKQGKVVSKKGSANGKKLYQRNGLAKWTKACQQARKAMGIKDSKLSVVKLQKDKH